MQTAKYMQLLTFWPPVPVGASVGVCANSALPCFLRVLESVMTVTPTAFAGVETSSATTTGLKVESPKNRARRGWRKRVRWASLPPRT